MASLTQIVAYVDRKYPNGETTANKIIDLNYIHTRVYTKIQRMKNQYEQWEITVVDGTPSYALASDCRVENILRVEVGTDANNTEFEEFEYVGINDDITNRKVYGRGTETTIFLFDDDGEV